MLSILVLCLALFHLCLSISALPVYPLAIDRDRPVAVTPLAPLLPATYSPTIVNPEPVYTYLPGYTYRPIRSSQANTSIQLPHFHSGPWDRAWEVYNNLADRFKIFKRSIDPALVDGVKTLPSARERIMQHLRPTSWWQRLKDRWTKFWYGEKAVKVVDQQYRAVVNKYRDPASRDYIRPNYPSRQRKNGRLASAFQTRPKPGQASYYRGRPTRYGS